VRTIASLILLAAVGIATPAAADGRKVIVMPSDGRADAKIRARIDSGVLKLARTLPDNVAPGEVSMVDLAAALGCAPDELACREEVLSTLGADEVISVSVVQKPQGFEVTLRRITKGAPARETMTLVTAEKAESVEGLATVFVARPPVGPTTGPARPTGPATGPATQPTTGPATQPPTQPAITTEPTAPTVTGEPPPAATDPAATTAQPAMQEPGLDKRPIAAPDPRDGGTRGSSRYYKIGMGVGGGLLLIGLLSWGSAADLGDQIQAAPVNNRADVDALKDLERRADDAARLGNVLVIGGLIVGGVSTYYYLKHKKTRSQSARLMPTVMPGGAGLVFGGSL
jgi:hypothetical protein